MSAGTRSPDTDKDRKCFAANNTLRGIARTNFGQKAMKIKIEIQKSLS